MLCISISVDWNVAPKWLAWRNGILECFSSTQSVQLRVIVAIRYGKYAGKTIKSFDLNGFSTDLPWSARLGFRISFYCTDIENRLFTITFHKQTLWFCKLLWFESDRFVGGGHKQTIRIFACLRHVLQCCSAPVTTISRGTNCRPWNGEEYFI